MIVIFSVFCRKLRWCGAIAPITLVKAWVVVEGRSLFCLHKRSDTYAKII
ncbi:hypothetical protein [Vacuolonema iberomarrocanum]|nr:hypothetical protein [filamentous cyanobacterium LEGE 07170]